MSCCTHHLLFKSQICIFDFIDVTKMQNVSDTYNIEFGFFSKVQSKDGTNIF